MQKIKQLKTKMFNIDLCVNDSIWNKELKSLKKSGRSFVVPVPIRSQNRRKFLFYHWLKSSVLARYEFSFSDRLTGELSDINSRRGSTINKLHFLSKSIKTNRVLIRKSRLSLL